MNQMKYKKNIEKNNKISTNKVNIKILKKLKPLEDY